MFIFKHKHIFNRYISLTCHSGGLVEHENTIKLFFYNQMIEHFWNFGPTM